MAKPKPMNRSDLVRRLVQQNPQLDAEILARYVDLVFHGIADTLAEGGRVEIRGFGSFRVKDRDKRVSRNPRTGEPVFVPAKRVPSFRPGRLLRERLAAALEGPPGEPGGPGEPPEEPKP